MTYKELYREIARERGYDNEEIFKRADTVAPENLNVEVPPDMVEELRAEFRQVADRVDSLSMEEIEKELKQHLSKN